MITKRRKMIMRNSKNEIHRYMGERQNARNPNIELLRIISMLMILILHYFNQGRALWDVSEGSINYYLIWVVEAICYVSVNCYMLISGYFLWKTEFKLNKLISFWLTGAFYSVVLFVMCVALNIYEFSVKGVFMAIFHVASRANWYVSVYFALYCLLPLLNYAIQAMSKKEMKVVTAAVLILFSIIPTVLFFWDAFGVSNGYSLLWYVALYLVGALLSRFYAERIKAIKTSVLILGMLTVLLLPIFKFAVRAMSDSIPAISGFTDILYKYNAIPVVIASVSMFCLFARIQISGDRITRLINRIAKTTLGVFIIHTHFALRDSLWIMLGSKDVMNSQLLWLHLSGCIILVFVICSFIDLGRAKLFDVLKVEKFVIKFSEKINMLFDKERLEKKND